MATPSSSWNQLSRQARQVKVELETKPVLDDSTSFGWKALSRAIHNVQPLCIWAVGWQRSPSPTADPFRWHKVDFFRVSKKNKIVTNGKL